MAFVTRQITRTSQPQELCAPNQKWMARGLVGLYNSATLPPAAATPSSTKAVEKDGVTLRNLVSGEGYRISDSRIIAGRDKSTVISIFVNEGHTSVQNGSTLYCERSEGVQIFKLQFVYESTSHVTFAFRNSSSQLINMVTQVALGSPSAASAHVVSLVTNGSASRTIRANGAANTNTTNFANTFTAANRVLLGGDSLDLTNSRFNGGLLATATFSTALSSQELSDIEANPWQLFEPITETIWIPDAVDTGGAATVTPSGVSAAASVGTATATGAATSTTTGVSAATAVGTPVAIGGATIPATVLPSGVSVTASVGTPTAIGGAAAIPATVAPAGVSATGSVGSLIATGEAWVVPSGVEVIGAVGTPPFAGQALFTSDELAFLASYFDSRYLTLQKAIKYHQAGLI